MVSCIYYIMINILKGWIKHHWTGVSEQSHYNYCEHTTKNTEFDFFQAKARGRGLHETMKPPFKSKVTKIKPLSRRKKDKQESTAWFDSDTLFGFGIDDE